MVRAFTAEPVDPRRRRRRSSTWPAAPRRPGTARAGPSWCSRAPSRRPVLGHHPARRAARVVPLARPADAPVLVCPRAARTPGWSATPSPTRRATGLGAAPDAWPVPYWWVDGGMAVEHLLLGAVDAGLGACFFGLFDHEAEVLAALGVPDGWRALGTVMAAAPTSPAPAARGRHALGDVLAPRRLVSLDLSRSLRRPQRSDSRTRGRESAGEEAVELGLEARDVGDGGGALASGLRREDDAAARCRARPPRRPRPRIAPWCRRARTTSAFRSPRWASASVSSWPSRTRRRGGAFEEAHHRVAPLRRPGDDRVHADQRHRAEQPAEEAVVGADDRVLDHVRQEEQHHQVEGVELREVALPGQAQEQEDADVDGDGPEHLLGDGDRDREQVVGDAGEQVRRACRAACPGYCPGRG